MIIKPNEWCPIENAPRCMYYPVPHFDIVDMTMAGKHLKHWLDTGDFDDSKQAGFWLYNAYKKALPVKYYYLANRIMNIGHVYGYKTNDYNERMKQTIIGILSVSEKDFDWDPYLAGKKGESRF